jgi:sec-independent protein translocase protein TatA
MNIIIAGFVGPWQIVIIVLVVVLLFGAKRIPQLMKSLGQGMKEFKNVTKLNYDSDEKEIDAKKDKLKE